MATFPERLRELRLDRKIMAKAMADSLGISYRNYQRYETGEIDPPASKLVTLADFFNVSIDYLVGRTDIPNPDVNVIAINREDLEDIKRDLYAEVDRRLAQRMPYAFPPYQSFAQMSKRA